MEGLLREEDCTFSAIPLSAAFFIEGGLFVHLFVLLTEV